MASPVETAHQSYFILSAQIIFNSLPNDKILDWSKLNAIRVDNLKVRVENIVGKGENAGYQHFLLFPPCFQKSSCPRSLKAGIVWGRGK